MQISDRIFVAGHMGMVGSAICSELRKREYDNLVLRTRSELDLREPAAVREFFQTEKPQVVILAAARVGGIEANIEHPAEFLHDNLAIQNCVLQQSYLSGVKKLCFLGSSCIYPRECPQPMKEEYLLTGLLEPTNEAYALAKIAGLKLVQYFRKQYGLNGISLMPCNLYGTNDSYHPQHSHVLSANVKRFVDAVDSGVSEVTIWGSGAAKREFMHVQDAAEAVIFLMERYNSPEIINVGWGTDVSIRELVELIADMTDFSGTILWDKSRPDGMPRKCLDVSRLNQLGYVPRISLEQGVERTIQEYRLIKQGQSQGRL